MITENNVIGAIKDSVNLDGVSPENFESTIEFIHRQYEIVLKAKDKEIEKCYQEILHLRKMVESLAKEPINIHTEIIKETEKSLLTNQSVISKIAKEAEKSRLAKKAEKPLLKHRLNPIPEWPEEVKKSLLANLGSLAKT